MIINLLSSCKGKGGDQAAIAEMLTAMDELHFQNDKVQNNVCDLN